MTRSGDAPQAALRPVSQVGPRKGMHVSVLAQSSWMWGGMDVGRKRALGPPLHLRKWRLNKGETRGRS